MRTVANVLINGADAGAAVFARRRSTNIDLNGAVGAFEAGQAFASVCVESVDTGGAVLARIRQAVVENNVTRGSGPSHETIAVEAGG